jgi:hypothetical protein
MHNAIAISASSLLFLVSTCATPTLAQSLKSDVEPLVQASCIDCHDAATETRLNFEKLDHDLTNSETFRQWEKIFDRVRKGEMPPKSEAKPDATQLQQALTSLERNLRETNLEAQRKSGRVPIRRMTRLEYEYTLHDLLKIRGELAKHLPPENTSSTFDTVAAKQGMSLVHIRSYLAAADIAIDEAIQLGPPPRSQPVDIDYRNSRYVNMWIDRPLRRGGSTVKMTDDAFVTFDGRPHTAQSNHMGYRPQYAGMYRITAEAYAYQARTPVTFVLNRSSNQQGSTQLIAAFDLAPGEPRIVEVTSYFTPQDFFYPAPADHDWQQDGRNVFSAKGAKFYKGEGLAIKWLKIEGPLEEHWPPERTRRILHGVKFKQRQPRRGRQAFELELTKPPREHVKDIIQHLGPLAFRRPLRTGEAAGFVRLAEPSLRDGQPFDRIVRAPLRAMLSSPQFLYHAGDPGELDDYALATRLSYFLWKSLPDDELFRLAANKQLREPDILARQVDRMLADDKSNRFVRDFLDQWLGLRDIDATTPDANLYPEYDGVLRQAMLRETRAFFRELINRDLSVRNLIDSNFTFLNRRLAEHYGLPNIEREHFRRVTLPADSVRGGLLTHASILKVTANGTVTSPVKRGNFVLSKLLGTPPNPPPPGIGSIEPDTRGTTTIRETLDAHRNVEACANCHRHIDPPGFAMECFDPIGGYRTRYRSTGKGDWPQRKLFGRRIWEYKEGLPVDASGVTADGNSFDGIRDFKRHLLLQTDQVARNVTSLLIVYATGGEIEFADREELDRIVRETAAENYPLRTILHKIVQSRLFRNK